MRVSDLLLYVPFVLLALNVSAVFALHRARPKLGPFMAGVSKIHDALKPIISQIANAQYRGAQQISIAITLDEEAMNDILDLDRVVDQLREGEG